MQNLKDLYDSIIAGDAAKARAITDAALAAGTEPLRLVREAMIPAMNEVGRRYECVEFFVPELILAARATKLALEPIRPLLAASGVASSGRVVIGTVKGDLHDIGKNLVAAMLEGAGFEVTDLGANVPPEKFVEAVKTRDAHIVALSALLTTTMPAMRATVRALQEAGLRERVKIHVGGAPITQKFADDIGADGYSESAPGAVALAKQAMGVA
jgi:corrinoid protein of di/trimethylamine methyltransferase